MSNPYIVSSSVTTLGTGSTINNTGSYTSISFQSGSQCTSIGANAFSNWSSLITVDFTNAPNLLSIGNLAFYSCANLTTVTYNDGTTTLGYGVFQGCPKLVTLNTPSTLSTYNNTIYLPSSITSFGSNNSYGLFSGCSAITTVYIGNLTGLLPVYMFQNCSNITSITFPNTVTILPDFCCLGCSKITTIIYSDNISNLGIGVFALCSSLVTLNTPSTLSIYTNSIYLPSTITNIGSSSGNVAIVGTFGNCTSITNIIMDGLTCALAYGMFSGVSKITSVTLPNSSMVNGSIFLGCSLLQSVNYVSGFNQTTMGLNTFQNCFALKSFSFPPSVISNQCTS